MRLVTAPGVRVVAAGADATGRCPARTRLDAGMGLCVVEAVITCQGGDCTEPAQPRCDGDWAFQDPDCVRQADVDCPQDTTQEGDRCVTTANSDCPAGWETADWRCSTTPKPTCADGWQEAGDGCSASPEPSCAPVGGDLYGQVCVTAVNLTCQDGTPAGGSTCYQQPTLCPDGRTYVDGGCVPDSGEFCTWNGVDSDDCQPRCPSYATRDELGRCASPSLDDCAGAVTERGCENPAVPLCPDGRSPGESAVCHEPAVPRCPPGYEDLLSADGSRCVVDAVPVCPDAAARRDGARRCVSDAAVSCVSGNRRDTLCLVPARWVCRDDVDAGPSRRCAVDRAASCPEGTTFDGHQTCTGQACRTTPARASPRPGRRDTHPVERHLRPGRNPAMTRSGQPADGGGDRQHDSEDPDGRPDERAPVPAEAALGAGGGAGGQGPDPERPGDQPPSGGPPPSGGSPAGGPAEGGPGDGGSENGGPEDGGLDQPEPLLSTAASLLFDVENVVPRAHDLLTGGLGEVRDKLTEHGVSSEMVTDLWSELASEVVGFVQVNVLEVALGAWCSWQTVRDAARRSAAEPGVSETLVLGPHTLTSEHERDIEILVGEAPVETLPLRLVLGFHLERARITVRDGHLVRLHPGPGQLTAVLTIAERVLKEATGPLPLPASIPLGRGLRVDEASPGPDPDGASDEPDGAGSGRGAEPGGADGRGDTGPGGTGPGGGPDAA
ncbi:hypothetical protein [Frankia sp. R43]|uniref:hypothetical protein n=1 Tax=Frankia sp. R43 TaxID=269536 RepID=UPI00128EC0DC|nr:hypothetical protein [Frankia sp. R43]